MYFFTHTVLLEIKDACTIVFSFLNRFVNVMYLLYESFQACFRKSEDSIIIQNIPETMKCDVTIIQEENKFIFEMTEGRIRRRHTRDIVKWNRNKRHFEMDHYDKRFLSKHEGKILLEFVTEMNNNQAVIEFFEDGIAFSCEENEIVFGEKKKEIHYSYRTSTIDIIFFLRKTLSMPRLNSIFFYYSLSDGKLYTVGRNERISIYLVIKS